MRSESSTTDYRSEGYTWVEIRRGNAPEDLRQYGWWRRRPMLPQRTWGSSNRIVVRRPIRSSSEPIMNLVYETRFQTQQAEIATLRESDHRRQAQMTETLRVMRDMRREMSNMQAELLAHREQQGRARQPGPDARIPDHQDASRDADSHV
ncbi:hypothetical protein Tco_0283079 [Tanacetum coccineum]